MAGQRKVGTLGLCCDGIVRDIQQDVGLSHIYGPDNSHHQSLTSVRSSTPTAGYRSGEGNEPSPCCGHPGRINALILRLQRMGCRTRVKQTRCVTYSLQGKKLFEWHWRLPRTKVQC